MTLRNLIQTKFAPGEIFTMEDISREPSKRSSAAVMLCNMAKREELRKLENGAYYIPIKSALFGTLPPSEEQVIKYICKKMNGYLSGTVAYNRLRLTEQVPNVIEIATTKPISTKKEIAGIRFLFKKAYATPVRKQIDLLQILDAITDIKNIPAKTFVESYDSIRTIITGLNEKQIKAITAYAKEYPPRTRFLLSRIMETTGNINEAKQISRTLNVTTKFRYAY